MRKQTQCLRNIRRWQFERMQERIERGSILIISHQERILNIADEIVVIADGKIVQQDVREAVLPNLLGTASAVDVCERLYQGKGGER